MFNFQVLKSECTETLFVQIDVLPISSKHRKSITNKLCNTLMKLRANGVATLFCIDEEILHIEYRFEDKSEVFRCEEICQALLKTYKEQFQQVLGESKRMRFGMAA